MKSATEKKTAPVKVRTQQRVLDMSAELFNRYGIEAVSVGQISEALNISAGNLTYHFKKKSDLLVEHVNRFEAELLAAVDSLPSHVDQKEFAAATVSLLGLTLRYRFLFLGANYIIQNDLIAPERYAQLVDSTKRAFVRQMNRLISNGYMRAIDRPYSVEMLVDSVWWQWLGWLLVMQIAPASKRQSERRMLAEAAVHIMFLSHHYIDPSFFTASVSELKKLAKQS